MGSPAATVTQKVDFQGFLSVALDAIQPPLSLRVLSSGYSSSTQTHRKHLLYLVGGHSLWRLGVGTCKGGIRESPHTVCFALTHLIVLGKINHIGSQPCRGPLMGPH